MMASVTVVKIGPTIPNEAGVTCPAMARWPGRSRSGKRRFRNLGQGEEAVKEVSQGNQDPRNSTMRATSISLLFAVFFFRGYCFDEERMR